MKISYYKPGDELNIILDEPKDSVLSEISDEIYLRLDPETNEILGLTILNFEERIKNKTQTIPISGHFILSQATKDLIGVT
ncbi:MAG: DUF2283 domain-containing protein [bacterium]|nr:DUF2283 domain-containing protein [bacterium]